MSDRTLEHLIYGAIIEDSTNNLLVVRKFGYSPALTADTEQDLWEVSGNKTLLSSASTLSVVSASANDTSAGTGARYLIIYGLDSNYDILNETVTMNGTTPVVTTGSFISVNNARVVSSGSGTKNAGNITITASTGGSTQAYIGAGESIFHASHFTVPNGYTCYPGNLVITGLRGSGGNTARNIEINQMAYSVSAGTLYETIRYGLRTDGGALILRPSMPSLTPAKTTIWFRVTADTTGTIVTSSQELLLVKGDLDRVSLF